MVSHCLMAIAGAAAGSMLPVLPGRAALVALLVSAACLFASRAGRPVACAVLGFVAFGWTAQATLDQRLPAALHGNKFKFTAQIIDFPQFSNGDVKLLLRLDDARLPRHIRLNWYRADRQPRLGETWEFEARLRRPRGLRNPGGFDYAGWLHRERVGATGYILHATQSEVFPAHLARARDGIAGRMRSLLPAGEARAALLAITLGARQDITQDTWQRYAVTGTSHLMAISGLHVGLVMTSTALCSWLVGGLLLPRGNIRDRALLLALPAATLYAVTSGFAVPSQRALLMAVCATFLAIQRRLAQPVRSLALVAVVVLLRDPLALLAPGFTLSFGAVAILLQVADQLGTRRPPRVIARLLRGAAALGSLQLALLMGMLPLTAWTFGRTSWLAPLANLLLLPVFSVVTVPAALLGILLAGAAQAPGNGLLWLAWLSLDAIHWLIGVLASVPGANVSLARPRGLAVALFLLPPLWLVLPRGVPGRNLAWLALAAVLIYRPQGPPAGCADVHTLDVGQGLAVVVRTRDHVLLYDTGPAFSSGSSSAERVILPYLRSAGISRLDMLIVSHADRDHAGGVPVLFRELQIDDLLVGEPLPHAPAQRLCARGDNWSWNDVAFSILHPPANALRDGNDSSCVLLIAAGPTRALLTGDIAARSEHSLLHEGLLPTTALVQVPHHGSRTSSSQALVATVEAKVGIVSAAFQNRWGFPKQDVVARWRGTGTDLRTTAESGALAHRLCPGDGLLERGEYRRTARRYWHDVEY